VSYIVIKYYGMNNILLSLRGKSARWKYPRPALEEMAQEMMRIESALFNSQGRRGGGSWKQLKPDTMRRKLFHDKDPRIMHESLRLRHSLTSRDDPENILDITEGSIRFGTGVEYAAAHQEGRGRMPARPIVKFTKHDNARMARILADWVMRGDRGPRR
jgi:phage gpG-like protein